MKWQRSIGLALAAIGLVIFAFWFVQVNYPTLLSGSVPQQTLSTTNKVAGAKITRPGLASTNQAGKASAPAISLSRTNVGGTNAASLARSATNAAPAWRKEYDKLRANPAFFPIAAGIPLGIGVLLLVLSGGKQSASRSTSQTKTVSLMPATARAHRGTKVGKVHQCNVLWNAPDKKQVWQFSSRSGGFALTKEQVTPLTATLPAKIVAKDWRTLFQQKLNVAWLPADQVFFRVAHFPAADMAEIVGMVELQLEKLSPMPVAQVVWTVHNMPRSKEGMQTVVVTIVARAAVEEYLGKLEADGYLADRLELALPDQLTATTPSTDGAWVYPAAAGSHNTALVAWFYGGVLQNLDMVTPATDDRAGSLREQLIQMAWAGELEGWLTSPPTWHLVAESATATEWEPILRGAMEQDVEVLQPLPMPELAAATADRAAHNGTAPGLMPPEFAVRYRQQFVDRIWMGALGAVVMLYLIGVGIYLVAVQVANFRTQAVEQQVTNLSQTYTNAIQLKAQYQVLKDRQELKFAALDCWKAVAEFLPEGITLEGSTFSDGKRLVLQGTAPGGQVQQIYQFEAAMRRVIINGQPLFDPTKGESLSYHTAPGGANLSWSFALELKRAEVQ